MTDIRYIRRPDGVAARRIGEELMIMSPRDASLFSLNETAALLWDAADGTTPIEAIVERDVCTAFEVEPAVALADARELAGELAAQGILEVSAEPLPPADGGAR